MKLTVRTEELNAAWLDSFEHARFLSLDCFDTLFWRKVISPTDVFTALERTALYQNHKLTSRKRITAEGQTRKRQSLLNNSVEVTLQEIYQKMNNRLDQGVIDDLIQAEITCEIEFGFIFKPIFDLLALARNKGLKVIIVSDTYLNTTQLRQMLFGTMPALEGMIDHIFCSSDYRKGKATGIWPEVLDSIGAQPEEVLHIGDNYRADLEGPLSFGIAARHFVGFTPEVGAILKQRHQVSVQVLPQGTTPLFAPQYFHGQLSAVEVFDAEAMGYVTLGPIFYAFANFISDEVKALQSAGHSVKVAYLMRDGYLPGQACEAFSGRVVGSYLNISRFTALAASLDSEDAIIVALEKIQGVGSYASALRQLLLPKAQTRTILKQLKSQNGGWHDLVRAVTRSQIKAIILEQSKNFRQRLLTHVQQLTDVQRGDTLMLVDVGYSGTAQLSLQKLFRDQLGVELVGRYLVANDQGVEEFDKHGLIDSSWADERLIASMTQYIAALEMMCSQNQPSTVGYKPDGTPILEEASIARTQSKRVIEAQRGCLRFIQEFVEQTEPFKPTLDPQQLRYGAAIDLIRWLYFPVSAEVSCLEGLEFDSNLGTDWKHKLLDVAAGEKALKNQGMGYITTNFSQSRPNAPMELRHTNLALSAFIFSHIRYGFDIHLGELSLRSQPLEALVVDGDQFITNTLTATPTYDGFYQVRIPRSRNFDVSLLIGAPYTYIQIESLQTIDPKLPADAVDLVINQDVILEGMQHCGNGLFDLDEQGFIYFPRYQKGDSGLAYSLVFRPLAGR